MPTKQYYQYFKNAYQICGNISFPLCYCHEKRLILPQRYAKKHNNMYFLPNFVDLETELPE